MEINETSTTSMPVPRAVACSSAFAGTWASYGHGIEVRRVTAPHSTEVKGTSVSAANRTDVAPAATALPMTSTNVDFGFAGSRSWRPPV